MKQNLTEKYTAYLNGKRADGSKLVLLKILDETSTDGAYSRICLAKCDCGRTVKRKLPHVLNGHIKSCGQCGFHSNQVSNSCLNDLTGKTFGYLKVMHRVGGVGSKFGSSRRRSAFYECECLYKGCGNHVVIRSDMIQSGSVATCGKCGYEHDRKNRLIGRSIPVSDETALRRRLYDMKTRCYNTHSSSYPAYGGRGITVCKEWSDPVKGPENFIVWALNNGFSQDLSIERIDYDGNYEPSNCRWIPLSEQPNNTRLTRKISCPGSVLTLAQAARILEIDPRRLAKVSNEDVSIRVTRELCNRATEEILSHGNPFKKE